MSKLKLEVGKTYVTREGNDSRQVVAINGDSNNDNATCQDNKGTHYFLDGRMNSAHESPGDLVAEANTPGGSAHPVPHTDLIRAALDGKTIQWFNDAYQDEGLRSWLTYLTPREAVRAIVTFPERKIRIKPEPIIRWMGVYSNGDLGLIRASKEQAARADTTFVRVLRLELDPETLEVISAKTEAP